MPADAVLIGVNQHAMLLQLDFVVAQDDAVVAMLREYNVPILAPKRLDGVIWSGVCPDFGFSGMDAVWIADFLGCDPVYVAGVDCFTGARRYWHSVDAATQKLGQRDTMSGWHKVRDHLRRPDRVRVLSGPLTEVFG